jgi:hypothetical protein
MGMYLVAAKAANRLGEKRFELEERMVFKGPPARPFFGVLGRNSGKSGDFGNLIDRRNCQ